MNYITMKMVQDDRSAAVRCGVAVARQLDCCAEEADERRKGVTMTLLGGKGKERSRTYGILQSATDAEPKEDLVSDDLGVAKNSFSVHIFECPGKVKKTYSVCASIVKSSPEATEPRSGPATSQYQ